jgi:hypothetical protein
MEWILLKDNINFEGYHHGGTLKIMMQQMHFIVKRIKEKAASYWVN